MKTRRFFTRALSLLLALWLLAVPALALPQSGAEQLALLEEIIEYIEAYALYPSGDLSLNGVTARRLERDPDLFRMLVESWLAEDPYGYFMNPEEYDRAFSLTDGAVYGIGIQVDVSMPLGVYVDMFLPGGGAESSGMETGAQIVFVDGVAIEDAVYMEVRPLFLGERGTTVEIGYINPGSAEVFFEEIERGPLWDDNVKGFMIDGTDTGYITFEQFSSIADVYDFDYYYNMYFPEMGARSVIIDLRGNPGGSLSVLFYMFNVMLMDEGYLLCRLVNAEEEEDWLSFGWDPEELAEMGESIWEPDRIVFLVDGGSASASEVFSGSMQAYGLAAVVGETTYGKAHSQYHIELTSGDILIITEARIELHNIGTYEGVGIIPDYEVELGIVTGAELISYPLDTGRALFRHSALTERVAAMQERLALLGYYRTGPSGVFDDYTLWCLNRFQVAYELPLSRGFVNAAALRALEDAAMKTEFYTDTQLDFALELCAG
ncbi:MAG: hypothetical protein LBH95_07330 [Oscillospiraceae bacterium]|jgi:carboxyl-terminal processing protease|nr:hypothetical protein [Oscillospiraceae bacterium]